MDILNEAILTIGAGVVVGVMLAIVIGLIWVVCMAAARWPWVVFSALVLFLLWLWGIAARSPGVGFVPW